MKFIPFEDAWLTASFNDTFGSYIVFNTVSKPFSVWNLIFLWMLNCITCEQLLQTLAFETN